VITNAISKIASQFRDQLRALAGVGLVSLFLDVAPHPASRPRVTRFNGVYYGAPYKRFYDAAKLRLEDLAGDRQPTDAPLIMFAEFLVKKPKTGTLDYPRGDTDNFSKGPLDAMTKVGQFWRDDNQIVGLLAFKRYAAPGEEPGVVIDYAEIA
jgi:Holliday junction resolvase RusA-like endonuclease